MICRQNSSPGRLTSAESLSARIIRAGASFCLLKQESNERPIRLLAWNRQTGQEDHPLATNRQTLGQASSGEQRFLPFGFSSI